MSRACRGAILFELVVALVVFAVVTTLLVGLARQSLEIVETIDRRAGGLDRARTALALLEAEIVVVEDLEGEPRGWLETHPTGDASFADAPPEASPWLLEVQTAASERPELTLVTVTARYGESASAVASAAQLVALAGAGDEELLPEDEEVEAILESAR